jgi:DNA repair protein RadA/Sms
LSASEIVVYAETDIHRIIETIQSQAPALVIVDSIQAVYSPALSGTPGSVGQIKECAGMLMGVAKAQGVTIFLVGHVTKEGTVSGPKLLEHTVDAVLYFEGEKYNHLRILRTVKNRFGNTQEIGVFEMAETGLRELNNPSELFLSESSFQNHPGSVIVATVEGTRPILVELQALVGQSTYPSPRRVANGVEPNRLHQVIAVLERRLGLDFSRQDVYVNVVGGLRIEEPAADLGIALAILTSQRNLSIRFGTVVAGEIGLTGEIRPVRHSEARLNEARKMGFHRILMPAQSAKSTTQPEGDMIECAGVPTLMAALSAALSPRTEDALIAESRYDDGIPDAAFIGQ